MSVGSTRRTLFLGGGQSSPSTRIWAFSLETRSPLSGANSTGMTAPRLLLEGLLIVAVIASDLWLLRQIKSSAGPDMLDERAYV